jgi:glycosyltransferase involved in cell wall biosynthesis
MSKPAGPDIWVIIPAFNEGQVIGSVLQELCQYGYKVVVIDDGSTDDTTAQALHHPVTVLRHLTNLGQGAALETGLRYVTSMADEGVVVTFDADGQHHVEDISRLVTTLQESGCDVVLGSRFLDGARVESITWQRRALLKLATWFTRVTTGLKLTDTHNGLRVFTLEAARKIHITQNGMAHASELLSLIADLKLSYSEAPVTISYTAYSTRKGQSVWNGLNILWDIMMGKMR